MFTLQFHAGTLIVRGADEDDLEVLPEGFRWDQRIRALRGPGWRYPETVLSLLAQGLPHALLQVKRPRRCPTTAATWRGLGSVP